MNPDKEKLWKKNCPKCGGEQVYKSVKSYLYCIRKNTRCRKCGGIEGAKYADKSFFQLPEYKDRMSCVLKEKRTTESYGESFKQKCRENKLKQIYFQSTQRTFSPIACNFIDQFNLRFGTKLQHGMNGGEVQFIGYSLDGYDKEKNIIFEYDEPKHHSLSMVQTDKKREKRLIEFLNPRAFWRYDEKYNKLIDVITNTEVIWQTQ